MELARSRHPEPRHGFVPCRHRRQGGAPIEPNGLRERQRCRHDHRGRLADGKNVRVVVVQAVGETSVGENRHRHRGSDLGADDRTFSASPPLDETQDGWREILAGRGDRDPNGIKNAQRDILAHLVGDRVEVECVGKLGQAIGTGGEKLRHVQLLIPAVATSHGIQSLAAANACSGFG